MKKQKLIFLIVLILSGNYLIIAQDTKFWISGYEWESMDLSGKLHYLQGLQHGDINGGRVIINYLREYKKFTEIEINQMSEMLSEISDIFLAGATLGQMSEGIDEFYKDYANKKIPVHCLATIVCKRVRGLISNEDIEKELQKLRKKW